MVDSIRPEDVADIARPGHHIAHFYSKAEQMVQSACCYIADGLRRGEAVIIVATRMHWTQMVGRLALKRGIDLVDAVMNGQLRHMDAELVLSGLLENGMPIDSRFRAQAGKYIERAIDCFGNVRIVTELAGILWEAGNRKAAIRLEELWNGLASCLPFALMCTYRWGEGGADGCNAALKCVCGAHSHLIPAESMRAGTSTR